MEQVCKKAEGWFPNPSGALRRESVLEVMCPANWNCARCLPARQSWPREQSRSANATGWDEVTGRTDRVRCRLAVVDGVKTVASKTNFTRPSFPEIEGPADGAVNVVVGGATQPIGGCAETSPSTIPKHGDGVPVAVQLGFESAVWHQECRRVDVLSRSQSRSGCALAPFAVLRAAYPPALTGVKAVL